MSFQGKKLGILISVSPTAPGFQHGLGLAAAALDAGVSVYLYCLDEAVGGIADVRLQDLRHRGANLFACAYAAQRRGLPMSELAAFSGLGALRDLISGTDRFVSFN